MEQIKLSDFMNEALKDDLFNIAYSENIKSGSQFEADLNTILQFFSWGTYAISDSFPYQFECMAQTGWLEENPILSYVFKRKSDNKFFVLHTFKFKIQYDHLSEIANELVAYNGIIHKLK